MHMTKRTARPVFIEWFDAYGDATEWSAIRDLDNQRRMITTVGMLISEKKGYYVVALSYDHYTKHVTGVIHIPKVNVKRLRFLTKK